MSRSHGRATLQNFQELAQNLENCMSKLKNYAFNLFFFFFFMIHTYYVILFVIFALFRAQKKSTFRMSAKSHSGTNKFVKTSVCADYSQHLHEINSIFY